jgi:hypothetical protein
MTPNTEQPDSVENLICLIGLMVVGLSCLIAMLGEMAWTREYLKKTRERKKPIRNTYHFGMEHEIRVAPIVANARQQIEDGLNIFRLRAFPSEKYMREQGEKGDINPGQVIHRTDVDVLYVYTGIPGPDGSNWRPVQWTATQRYLSGPARRAPSTVVPVTVMPEPPAAVDATPAKRKFLPLNPSQG